MKHLKSHITLALLLSTTIAHAQSPATGQILGHGYVDLGLSVMWATCNIGASSPSDYGDYFACGEAETKAEYTEGNSATYGKSTYTFLDAASVNWGSVWRMPTHEEFEELLNQCTYELKTVDSKDGFLFTGPNGNSIFLPFAGSCDESLIDGVNEWGNYWSSTYDASYPNVAGNLKINAAINDMFERYIGNSVRPVTEGNVSEKEGIQSSGQISGHDYVDLGLSVMWATCNIGASQPFDYGSYFAWGERLSKSFFSEKNSTTYKKNKYTFFDAARCEWGEKWRMPTQAECEELVNKCSWLWTTMASKQVVKITGPNGNFIILPAAGYYGHGGTLDWTDTNGQYWSSTPVKNNKYSAYGIRFSRHSFTHGVQGHGRFHGTSIRPVTEK